MFAVVLQADCRGSAADHNAGPWMGSRFAFNDDKITADFRKSEQGLDSHRGTVTVAILCSWCSWGNRINAGQHYGVRTLHF
eukprot:SAG31_NODE_1_length_62978_cov_30.836130_3_plen_81_part_00